MNFHRHPANIARHDRQSRVNRAVDGFVTWFGSLPFIVYQTIVVAAWIILNITAYALAWDPYPFILLNLVFSTQAAYAAPLILLSQNRAAEHDRMRAEEDYTTNNKTLAELTALRTEHTELRATLVSLLGRPEKMPDRESNVQQLDR